MLLNLPDDARERLRQLALQQGIDIETLIERWIWREVADVKTALNDPQLRKAILASILDMSPHMQLSYIFNHPALIAAIKKATAR